MDETVLLWFKNDLRLNDNEALTKAIASGRRILPVYIFDPKLYRNLDLGFPKTDRVRFEFAKQCVADLRKNIEQIGGNLLVLTGHPEKLIPELITSYNCKTIFAEQEFATEELNQIERINNSLGDHCVFDSTWGRTLYHIDDIPYKIPEIPLTSKTFRINTTQNTEVRNTIAKPSKIEVVALSEDERKSFSAGKWGQLPEASSLGFDSAPNFALTYVEGGETKALERLNYYLFETEQLTRYRWTRNRSLGLEYSSKFSPYMALGCLSPRTIYEAVKRYEKEIKKNQSTWWLVFGIIWRDYFTFKLMRFQNQVYQTEGYTDKTREFTNEPELFER